LRALKPFGRLRERDFLALKERLQICALEHLDYAGATFDNFKTLGVHLILQLIKVAL